VCVATAAGFTRLAILATVVRDQPVAACTELWQILYGAAD